VGDSAGSSRNAVTGVRRREARRRRVAFVNFSTREVTAKIVYYGPGLCGKTTSLQYIFDSIISDNKGQMVSLATDVDRTIYFDFLPVR
jgi:GTPase SAR1 family protein